MALFGSVWGPSTSARYTLLLKAKGSYIGTLQPNAKYMCT